MSFEPSDIMPWTIGQYQARPCRAQDSERADHAILVVFPYHQNIVAVVVFVELNF